MWWTCLSRVWHGLLIKCCTTSINSWNVLKHMSKRIEGNSYLVAGFPDDAGAIDYTHVAIRAPPANKNRYRSRKSMRSITMQVVCDPYMCILSVKIPRLSPWLIYFGFSLWQRMAELDYEDGWQSMPTTSFEKLFSAICTDPNRSCTQETEYILFCCGWWPHTPTPPTKTESGIVMCMQSLKTHFEKLFMVPGRISWLHVIKPWDGVLCFCCVLHAPQYGIREEILQLYLTTSP